MDYSYIFRSAKIRQDALEAANFTTKDNEQYLLTIPVSNGAFNADISLNIREQSLTVHLFDSATGEKYVLFDVKNAQGAFVASLREEVQSIIDGIRSRCFEAADLKGDYISFLNSQFAAEPDYPWPDLPDYCVFRCSNQKWFALIMKIKYRQLGLAGEEYVWVVNIKADADKIRSLIDCKSIFPAWHMNKKHWITILLTAAADFEKLQELTKISYELVIGKKI